MINKKCLFIGSKQLGLKALQVLHHLSVNNNLLACITIDDTNDIRTELKNFVNFCAKEDLNISILEKPSQIKLAIEKYQPDFCIVVGWYWVLASNILQMVPDGIFGLHASLLPKYRGGSPLVWQIINSERYGGVSLFRFDEGMDTGEIFGQDQFEIGNNDTIKEVLSKTEDTIIELLNIYYPKFIKGNFIGEKQKHNCATYCSIRKPEDGQINWEWSADYIYNFIRAQTKPYPGAFCYRYNGDKVIIWRAKKFEFGYYGVPGRINQSNGEGVVVTCGQGAIVVQTIQLTDDTEVDAQGILKFGETLQ